VHPRWILCGIAACVAACSSDTAPQAPPVCSSSSPPLTLAVGAPQFINPLTTSGCIEVTANTSNDSAEYLVIAQSAGGTPGDSAPYSLQSGGLAARTALGAASTGFAKSRSIWARLRQRGPVPSSFARRLHERRVVASQRIRAGTGALPAAPTRFPRVAPPALGSTRTFNVCADYFCDQYQSVTATVQSVTAHVIVYVDQTAPTNGLTQAEVDSLNQIFNQLYVVDTTTFGGISDIDSNGVVLALMTGVVNKLVSAAECESGGYVAGFFDPNDIVPDNGPTGNDSNHGEIFYTVVADPSGILSCAHVVSDLTDVLPTTFLHELQHVIGFNQHVLVRGGPEEDVWLDEGLSSYAEEVGGRSFLPDSNTFLNYAIGDLFNAYIYLQDPQHHFLLQESDTVLEDFGAGWLYIRYLMDQYGPSLAAKLEQTTLTGTTNVATQTGVPFATSSGRWSMANWASDLPGFAAPAILQYTSWPFRSVYGALNAVDPQDFPSAYPLAPTQFVVAGAAAGFAARAGGAQLSLAGYLYAGSGAYTLALQPAGGPGFSLLFSGQSGSISSAIAPQLDLIRLH